MTISCGTKNAQENTEVKEFETASEAVQKMAAGWNLGNSLDAFSSDIEPGSPIEKYETAWGQPATEDFLMKQLAAKGFTAIRVPTTWWQHMDKDGLVDSLWMNRVQQVVDYVINNGMYCLLNVPLSRLGSRQTAPSTKPPMSGSNCCGHKLPIISSTMVRNCCSRVIMKC